MSNDIKTMTIALNDLLADVCGLKKRVSEILADYGLEQYHIDALKDDLLYAFHENLKFALGSRLLYYAEGHRMLDIICRRYGLFGCEIESLDEISASIGISREQIYRLHSKGTRRIRGKSSAISIGALITYSACQTLKLDAFKYLEEYYNCNSNEYSISADGVTEPTKPGNLPEAVFYISGGFDFNTRRGRYSLLVQCAEQTQLIEKHDLEGRSDVNMVLLAVIEGLTILRQPHDITIYSNTLFGVTSIYKKGVLRQDVPKTVTNYELKAKIYQLLTKHGHRISNESMPNIKAKLSKYKSSGALALLNPMATK